MSRQEEILDGLYQYTLDGDAAKVIELTEEGLEIEIAPLTMVFDALIPSLEEVGRLFEVGDYFVPEMLISAKAMQGAMNILKPLIAKTGFQPIGTFVMGTVKGDIHDIGKNLVNIMLEGASFFVAAIKEHRPQAVGMSAFLTTTMPMFKVTIEAIKEAGLRDQVKILVGGAPVNQEYADRCGADGFAPDASAAVRLTKELIGLK